MLRSINIEMTDRLIWDLIKSTLREIRERQDDQGEEMGLEEHSHYEGDGISTEGFSWVTAEQADMLSDEERKVLINNMITTITVHFDAKLNKHRLTVRFSEEIRRLFEKTSTEIRPIVNNTESSSGDSGTLCEVRDGLQGENSGKKSWGSRINSAAKIDYSVTVE
jgi:hypothetical protein